MERPDAQELRARVLANWTDPQTFGAWERWHGKIARQQQAVSDALIEAAGIRAGCHVLDLAGGSGEPAIQIAGIVGPGASVCATDVSEGMLDVARRNARAAGAGDRLSFRVADAEELPFEANAFDAVTSRMGAMFFVDFARALAHIRRVLKPGGRVAFAVWGPQDRSLFFRTLVEPFTRYFTPPSPPPDAPQPFRFAQAGSLSNALRDAGFSGVQERTSVMPMPWYGPPEENWNAFDELASPAWIEYLSESERRAALDEVMLRLRALYDGEAVRLESAVVLASAAKPGAGHQ